MGEMMELSKDDRSATKLKLQQLTGLIKADVTFEVSRLFPSKLNSTYTKAGIFTLLQLPCTYVLFNQTAKLL